MEYINRKLESVCEKDLKSFPILTLTGPRQCGKSTLLRHLLPDWRYVNLEEPAALDFALQDPKGFINTYSDQVIFDEIQRAPKLLSQLQVEIDKDRRAGRFAVTGSHNLLLLEHVSQSLAGRTAVRHLLPFSFSELSNSKLVPDNLDSILFNGGYPPVYQDLSAITTWYDSYIQTYVERDVRLIQNISDLVTFRRFLRLCAGRVGQLLDFSGIGGDAGVSHNTVRNWINILEAGFIAFRLEPYFRNFSKRIIKSPKLYFYDTGLLCRLLEIRTPRELSIHPFRGNIFENWCVVEAMKSFYNSGRRPALYFWRDQSIEVDLLIEQSSTHITGLECKSGATPVAEFIEPALKLSSFAKDIVISPGVVFGGDESQMRSSGPFYGWKQFAEMLPDLISGPKSR